MRELTEVNAVLQNLVDLLQEVSSGIAVRATRLVVRGLTSYSHVGRLAHGRAGSLGATTISTSRDHLVLDLLVQSTEGFLGRRLDGVNIDLLHEVG